MPTLSEAEYAYYTANSGTTSSSNITNVSLAAGTSAAVLAADSTRLGATIHNATTQTVYLALASTASAAIFTVQLLAGSYYEVPFRYKGPISAFSVSASSAPHLVVTTIK